MAGATALDQVALALLQVTLNNFIPDGVVLHPADWLNMMLTKDAAGGYLLGDPAKMTVPNIWGYPVVASQAMTVGKVLVGQFSTATLYDRWAPRVEVLTEHADFFTRNLVAIRAEERIGLAVKQPTALVYGNVSPS